jgi:hypothetical protein
MIQFIPGSLFALVLVAGQLAGRAPSERTGSTSAPGDRAEISAAIALAHRIDAAELCDYSCNPNCWPGYSGTVSTPGIGHELNYNSCSFWFYCTNNCDPNHDDYDSLEAIVQGGSLEALAAVVGGSDRLRLNSRRNAVQMADCAGTGVIAHWTLSRERFDQLAAELERQTR